MQFRAVRSKVFWKTILWFVCEMLETGHFASKQRFKQLADEFGVRSEGVNEANKRPANRVE